MRVLAENDLDPLQFLLDSIDFFHIEVKFRQLDQALQQSDPGSCPSVHTQCSEQISLGSAMLSLDPADPATGKMITDPEKSHPVLLTDFERRFDLLQ